MLYIFIYFLIYEHFQIVYFSLVSFGLGGFFGLQSVLVAVSRKLALPFSGGLLETLLAGGIVIWWVLIRNSRYESYVKNYFNHYSRILNSYINLIKLLLAKRGYYKIF